MGDILKTGHLSYSQKKVLKSSWSKKYFALLSKSKYGICLVGFQSEEIFKRFEAEKQTIDASKIEKRLKSYAQVLIPNMQCLNRTLIKGEDAMETMTDSGKKYLLMAEQVGNNTADSWVITYQYASSQNTFAALGSVRKSPSEQRATSLCGGENENDLYESTDEGISFEIMVIETEASSRLNLYGTFDIQINSRNLTLYDQKTKKQCFVWPFKYLRRYGRTSTEFSFEAGRRCESGEGLFKFCTLKGNEIFYIVEGMATAIREKERQIKPGGSFRGSTPPPILNVPRPTSLRKKFLQNQSKSVDYGADVKSEAPVYAEPMKRSSTTVKKNITASDRKNSAPLLGSLYAFETPSQAPTNNNEDTYAEVGPKAPKVPVQVAEPPAMTYVNIKTDTRPPVPPKLLDAPKITVTASAGGNATNTNTQKTFVPSGVDEADYADPDELDHVDESAYAYACAEDIKRDLPWMKEPEPGAVKFQVEAPDYETEYDY